MMKYVTRLERRVPYFERGDVVEIDIFALAGWVSAAGALGGADVFIARPIFKALAELRTLKANDERRQKEREVMIKGLLACLNGLKTQGANGPVTEGIRDINDYLVKNASD
jgi:hypothetical protein